MLIWPVGHVTDHGVGVASDAQRAAQRTRSPHAAPAKHSRIQVVPWPVGHWSLGGESLQGFEILVAGARDDFSGQRRPRRTLIPVQCFQPAGQVLLVEARPGRCPPGRCRRARSVSNPASAPRPSKSALPKSPNSNLVSAIMMPRARAKSAANRYSASAAARTWSASGAPKIPADLVKGDVLIVRPPPAALVAGAKIGVGRRCASFRPHGSSIGETLR